MYELGFPYYDYTEDSRTAALRTNEVIHASTGGVLTQYTYNRHKLKKIKPYIRGIPQYIGNTVPNILRRSRTTLQTNYMYFTSFLYYFSKYGTDNNWVLGGLITSMSSSESGKIHTATQLYAKGSIKKQFICKRVGKLVVVLFNVTDSNKMYNDGKISKSINEIFKNKIFIVDYSTATPGQNVVVKCYNIDTTEDTDMVDPLDQNSYNPTPKTELTVEGIDEILGQGRNELTADPNFVYSTYTVVEWFDGGKSIFSINIIVDDILARQTLGSVSQTTPSLNLASTLTQTYSIPGPGPGYNIDHRNSRGKYSVYEKKAAVSSGGNGVKKIKSKFQKRRRSRRYRLNTTRKLKKRAHKTSRRRRVHSYKK